MSAPPSSSAMSSGDAPTSSSPVINGGSAPSAVRGGSFSLVFRRPSLEREESSDEEEEQEDFLCTFICDLLAGLRRSPKQCWDEGICQRVSAGLKKCHLHKDILDDDDSGTEDVVTVDIRGRYARDAKRDLMIHLFCCSRMPDVKYLKVIVGCKVHGVGKGILRQTIIDLLESDDTIVWKRENGGSVISINIDDEKDYRSLDWKEAVSMDKEQWDEAVCQVVVETEGAEVTEEEDDFLCTFICDFLFGIPKLGNTCWDTNMCKRIAAGVSRCDRAEQDRQRKIHESQNIVEDTITIGVEGQYVEDALPLIKRHLYCSSCMCSPVSALRFFNVQVGCKIHGVGKGKLKQAVIDMLETEDDLKWREFHRGAVISIELDGRNFFNFLGEDFDPLHPRFGDCFDLLL